MSGSGMAASHERTIRVVHLPAGARRKQRDDKLVRAVPVVGTPLSVRNRDPRPDSPRVSDRVNPMRAMLHDARHALRGLARTPTFAVAALLILSLGIGASVAIYSIADHILFRPLDLPDSERLVTICEKHESLRACTVATPNLVDWTGQTPAIEAMGAARSETMALRGDGRSQSVVGGIAMPGFLLALGLQPARGRLFTDADAPPAAAGDVAVVTDGFWREEMGADPGAVGRPIELDGKRYTVIGVLPADAMVPRLDYVRVWVPLPWDPAAEENRDWRGFVAAARLAPGASVEDAERQLRSADRAMAEQHPDALKGWDVQVLRIRDYLTADARPLLFAFLAVAVLVLALVVANMAGLLLTRATARELEIAVRRALGAGSIQVVSQLLAESLVLAVLGGLGGILVAVWAVRAFVSFAPAGIPRLDEVAVDGSALLVAMVVALGSGMLFGLAPALGARGADLQRIFRGGRGVSSDRRAGRTRARLVIAQLSLALILVTGAGLLVRSFNGLLRWDPGFDTEHLLTFWLPVSEGEYATPPEVLQVYRRVEEGLAALPGVRGVGTVSAGPLFGGGDGTTPFLVEGRGGTIENAPAVAWYDAGPGYFSTLGVPLLRGRMFTERDVAGGPLVVVINRAMGERFWPDADPIGARLRLPREDMTVEVIGVVEDIRPFYPGRPPAPELYFSNRQRTRWSTYFVLRTSGAPGALAGPATSVVQGIDPDLQPSSMATMPDHIAGVLVGPRFTMLLVGLFAFLAVILGLVGLYGVIAYGVEARRGEIGVRLALGASPRGIVGWVVRDAAVLVAIGGGIGIIGALLFERLLASMIYGISPLDPPAYLAAVALLLLGALAASTAPALRAGGVDPARSLREGG